MPRPTLSPPPKGVRLMLAYFTFLHDPRVDRTKRHELSHLIVMALCGTLCGADGWDDLEDYADANVEWFRGFLDLPNGTPSADTFRHVFSALEPIEFERQFRAWVRAFADSLEGEVVAIDGKTLRGTVDAATKQTSLHLLHVWATDQQLLLAHVAVDGAGAEAPGIPELLRLVDIKGAIITTDAAGCTAPVTQAVRDGGAHYVLTLKANRRALHTHVTALFDAAEARRYRGVATHRSAERGHGREETRTVRVLPLADLPSTTQVAWSDLNTIAQVERTRTVDGKTSTERHLYISSLPPDPKRLAHAIRAHWGVENQLHWCLDVGFLEDQRRIHDVRAATNLATITRYALMMVKREKTSRRGIRARRRNAAWSHDYLLKILTAGIARV